MTLHIKPSTFGISKSIPFYYIDFSMQTIQEQVNIYIHTSYLKFPKPCLLPPIINYKTVTGVKPTSKGKFSGCSCAHSSGSFVNIWFLFCNQLVYVLLYKEHLSKDRTAAQSRTWACRYCTTYLPNNAVDGNISTCMRASFFGPTSQYQTAWWYVDLWDIKSVYSIMIQFKDYDQQFGNDFVIISDRFMYRRNE